MNIPNFLNSKFVDSNGFLDPAQLYMLQQLISELQNNVGNKGFQIPTFTNEQLFDLAGKVQNGCVIFNSTTEMLMVKKTSGFVNV